MSYRQILPHQTGYRNHVYPIKLANGGTCNLIIYKNEPGILSRIKAVNSLGSFLAEYGFPARKLYKAGIVQLKSSLRTRYAALYNYLPGQTIPWEAYTMEHLKALGGAMGQLHTLLVGYDGELPSATYELRQYAKRMQRYFNQTGAKTALKDKLGLNAPPIDFTAILDTCQNLPGQHALHLDFVRGNILFQNKIVVGVLDFEKAAHGHPILDVARTLAFLLVDCKYKPEVKIRKYFLTSGYNKRGLTKLDVAAPILESLIDFFLLHDFYKFLRHNPYESLPDNEHFMRTKALLVKRGRLTPIQ